MSVIPDLYLCSLSLYLIRSAEYETSDQLLESVLVGLVNVGNCQFVLQAYPSRPRVTKSIILLVLLLACSYLGQEFVRVGYCVNSDYDDEQLREEPPAKILIDKVQRNILSDKPKVTKFPINFHPANSESGEQLPPFDHLADTDGDGEPVAT
ncbi:Histone chaperone, ASF1-like [Trema orientale]|uniref:Histone chaperone, ASF1-like n=1 Tax=Trema orientale TaxID=63057 RepID=A0A2P5DD26_TREOI|nr:Histone chaperone, ASF1-like [Trema orientale]